MLLNLHNTVKNDGTEFLWGRFSKLVGRLEKWCKIYFDSSIGSRQNRLLKIVDESHEGLYEKNEPQWMEYTTLLSISN